MKIQKFKRGDLVHIAKNLGPDMCHFQSDEDAIVMYSYADEFGGTNVDSYGVLFTKDGSECAWYHTHQLTFLKHVGESEITRIVQAREAREKIQSDLTWIVENWSSIRETTPGASMHTLMALIGITEPWGKNGEGITYYINCYGTRKILDQVLSTGDVERVKAFCTWLCEMPKTKLV